MSGFTNPQNLNRYGYVRNNPLRYTDPSGHMVACEDGDICDHDYPSPSGGNGGNGNNPNDPTDEEDDPNPNGLPVCSSILCGPNDDQGSSTTSPYTGAQQPSTWFSTPGYSAPEFVVGAILVVGGLGFTVFGTALGFIAVGEIVLGAETGPGEVLIVPHALAMTAVGGVFLFGGLGTAYVGYLAMKDALTP